jgi:Fe-S oxidoreductase
VRAQPRRLLADIPGLSLREIASAEICCGSAGVWNVLNPEPARELGGRKARDVLATGADLLVTATPLPDAGGRGGPSCRWRDRSGTHRAGARRVDPCIAGAIAAALLIPAVI